ncbi:MAG TPA: hypothetical protein VFG30_02660 [Polyangiales bacterium]|nr:hypothetical protein [Polyangiales bacterium]
MKTQTLISAVLFCLAIASQVSAQQMSGTDWDADYIDDGFETTLAKTFFPNMNMHCNSFEEIPKGSRGQFYGTDVGFATNGKLPFTAHIYYDNLLAPCNVSGRCIEVRFGMAYNWDLGDDTFGGGHRGDPEVVSVLLRTEQPWSVAQKTPGAWFAWKVYRSAHACTDEGGDSSSFQTWNSYSAPNVYVSEGKNGNYVSTSACNNGGFASADDCSDNRCWINRSYAVTKLQNAFEFGSPNVGPFPGFIPRWSFTNGYMGPAGSDIIPFPGASPEMRPSGQYFVWSNTQFGASGSYCKHLTRFVDWAYHTQSCERHPSCP